MSRRYLFIINSRSNPRVRYELEDAYSKLSPDDKLRIDFRYTEYGGHAADLAVECSNSYGDKVCIVACGGDGTIHEIANALAFRTTPMLCLPLGTGNDFTRTIYGGKPKVKIADFLSKLDSMVIKPIDLIRIDSYDVMGSHLPMWSCYSNNVSSIGLDTRVQALAKSKVAKNPKSLWVRKTAYASSALTLLFKNRDFKFKYKLELENGETIEGTDSQYTLLSICNGSYYGGGFCPAPNADIRDGLADVCVIDSVTVPRALNLILSYKAGKHIGKEGVHYYRCTSGIIETLDSSYELEGNYDGEDFFGHRIRFEVFQNALNLATIDLNQ